MAVKTIYSVGSATVLGKIVETTDDYKYDEDTFEYKGVGQLFDGGKKAKHNSPQTFESIKSFIESKGTTELIPQNHG
jgi:hypothetical protein